MDQLVRQMLQAAGHHGARWKSLVGILSTLPPELRNAVLGEMEQLDVARLDEEGRLEFRDALREEAARSSTPTRRLGTPWRSTSWKPSGQRSMPLC